MELSFEPFAQVASVNDQTQARLYYRRFVEAQFAVYGYGHMVFAAYAAVPALLTPDLAYKLWQNFSTYQWRAETRYIHRIAVSDVLLHLCEELGQELYEMPAGLKLALLDWLNKESQDENELNLSNPQQIAQFVVDYHQNPTRGFQRYGSGYEDLQLWTAQHVLDPEYAYNKVYEALRSKLDDQDEFLRLLEFWDQLRLNGQALGYALTPDQENLAALKPSWKALIQEDSVALQQELQHLAGRSDLRQYLQPTKGEQLLGLSIPGRLQSVVQELVSSIEQESSIVVETEAADGPSVHGILIGVGRAEGREDWPVWDDVWAVQEYFAELCQSQGANWRPHVLIDSREDIPQKELSWVSVEQPLHFAQLANVQQVVKQILALPSHPQDVLVIYYQGLHHPRFIQLEDQILDLNDYLPLINRFSSFLLFEGFELDKDLDLGPEVLQKPFAQFRATHATQQSLNQVIGGKKRAPFTHFFLEVLREGGFQRSYSEVFYRSEFLAHNLLPQLQCTSTYYNLDYKTEFFTGTLAGSEFQYLLEYGGEGSWHLNAGKNWGITPSSDFMQTIVRTEDGREFIIGDVYENRALIRQKIEWLAESRPQAIPVTLLQMAIPRMKIAFEPGIAIQARADMEEAIARHQIYYVEFVDNVDEARFFIRFLEDKRFALFNQLSSRLNPREEEYPLFVPVEAPYLFIVQIEHIAKWYGVLEYDNLRGALPKESISWEVETFTGASNTPQRHNSPRQVALHYENGQEPRLGCKVVNQSAQALFVSCIYLDASFEITNTPLHPERIEPGQEVWLFEKVTGERTPKIGIPEVVEQFKKAEYVTEFIKFFVSEQYFSPEAFEQSTGETEVMRGVNFKRSNVFRGFEGGDWTSVVVPVVVSKTAHEVIQPYTLNLVLKIEQLFLNNRIKECLDEAIQLCRDESILEKFNNDLIVLLADTNKLEWDLNRGVISLEYYFSVANRIKVDLFNTIKNFKALLKIGPPPMFEKIKQKSIIDEVYAHLNTGGVHEAFTVFANLQTGLSGNLSEKACFLLVQYRELVSFWRKGHIEFADLFLPQNKIIYSLLFFLNELLSPSAFVSLEMLNTEQKEHLRVILDKLIPNSKNNKYTINSLENAEELKNILKQYRSEYAIYFELTSIQYSWVKRGKKEGSLSKLHSQSIENLILQNTLTICNELNERITYQVSKDLFSAVHFYLKSGDLKRAIQIFLDQRENDKILALHTGLTSLLMKEELGRLQEEQLEDGFLKIAEELSNAVLEVFPPPVATDIVQGLSSITLDTIQEFIFTGNLNEALKEFEANVPFNQQIILLSFQIKWLNQREYLGVFNTQKIQQGYNQVRSSLSKLVNEYSIDLEFKENELQPSLSDILADLEAEKIDRAIDTLRVLRKKAPIVFAEKASMFTVWYQNLKKAEQSSDGKAVSDLFLQHNKLCFGLLSWVYGLKNAALFESLEQLTATHQRQIFTLVETISETLSRNYKVDSVSLIELKNRLEEYGSEYAIYVFQMLMRYNYWKVCTDLGFITNEDIDIFFNLIKANILDLCDEISKRLKQKVPKDLFSQVHYYLKKGDLQYALQTFIAKTKDQDAVVLQEHMRLNLAEKIYTKSFDKISFELSKIAYNLSKLASESRNSNDPKHEAIMKLSSIKVSAIKDFLSKGNLDKAIEELENSTSFNQEIVLLSFRYVSLNQNKYLGLLNIDELNLEYNRLVNAILELCNSSENSLL